jgi:hypothetical protein
MPYAGYTPEGLANVFNTIDASKAKAYCPKDTTRIHSDIVEKHCSLANFSAMLKLRLLLDPLSYTSDTSKLTEQSIAQVWNFESVDVWLKDPNGSRLLVVPAGAGTGKSTISAALIAKGVVTAYHFFKYNDQRRLDMVRVIKSLAHQLAERCAVSASIYLT